MWGEFVIRLIYGRVKNSPDLVNATERLFAEKKRKFEILKELEILKFRIENL